MKRYGIIAGAVGILVAASSCEPELEGVVSFASGNETETKSLVLSLESESWPSTKTSLGEDVESIFSGAVLAAYDASTGRLDSELEIAPEALGGEVSMTLPAGRKYNLYILGNLWEIGSGGRKRRVSFPPDEASLKSLCYRMDGGDAGDGYRREKFSEAALYGIPLYWSQANVDIASARVNAGMKRLFARLTVEVDHSGIAGSSLENFVNGSLRIRQINCRLSPFDPEGSRALSSEDIIDVGDGDLSMQNALCGDFVYYVPENRQGVLLPDNTDPALKNIESVEAVSAGLGGRLTYVEFRGEIGEGSGFGGTAVYRFLLGKDAVSDFDIERNLSFRVELGFRLESIFGAEWKVEVEGLSDRREFYLSGELAGRVSDGRRVVVRKNRPAVLDLNILMRDGGPNLIDSALLVDEGYQPEHIGDVAWTSDFWSATHDAANEPKREALAALGIAVSYAGGRFLFEVSDPSRFVPGESVPVVLTLYPGGKKTGVEIVCREDITVSSDNGLPSDPLYVAQRRSLSFSGFEGNTIYYVADQNSTSGGQHCYNMHWKTSTAVSDPFPTCKTDSDGAIVYPFRDSGAYASQSLSPSGRLEVCCFYPNDLRATEGTMTDGAILICSDDPLNDGIIRIPLYIMIPRVYATEHSSPIVLSVDGTEMDIFYKLLASDRSELDAGDFDPELVSSLLTPTVSYDVEAYPWLAALDIDVFKGKVYVARTSLDSGNIEDAFLPGLTLDNSYSLGTLTVTASSLMSRYALPKKYSFKLSIPRLRSTVSEPGRSLYLSDYGTEGEICVKIYCDQTNGDLSRFEFTHSGEGAEFTCMKSGKVLRPVTEGEYDGSSVYAWYYREDSQPSLLDDGEYVPGGLIVPYGPQEVRLAVTNKWDGRTIVSSRSFVIEHDILLQQVGIFGSYTHATVYPMPPKNITYILSLHDKVGYNTRKWLLTSLGSNEWLDHYLSGPDFYMGVNKVKYRQMESGVRWKKNNFPVSYMDAGATVWTEALAKKAFEGGVWLDDLYSDLGTNGWQEDVEVTGNQYMRMFFGTNKGGYVFTDSYIYW